MKEVSELVTMTSACYKSCFEKNPVNLKEWATATTLL